MDSYINLMWYGSRWYDSELGRFIQPDTIVPSVGEGNNPNAVGYVANANYSALTVDYHENQFLDQLNQENQSRLEDPNGWFPTVPTNPLAFDRYAYTFNNPVRYNDPSGHCPWCVVVAVVVIAGAPIEITVGMAVLATAAVVITVEELTPGAQERHEAAARGLEAMTESARAQFATAAEGIAAIGLANKLPKGGEFPYNPPKQKGNPPYVRTPDGGFKDGKGNTWKRDKSRHGGDHWDVTHPDGSHTNVNDDGSIRP